MGLGRFRISSSRKQSASSGEQDDNSSGTSTPSDNEGAELTKTQSRIMRKLTGGFKSHRPRKSADRDELSHLHKPFNRQNLEHQEILSAFEWNFGRRSSQARSIISNISPCASRRGSFDVDHHPMSHDVGRESSVKDNAFQSQDLPQVDEVESVR